MKAKAIANVSTTVAIDSHTPGGTGMVAKVIPKACAKAGRSVNS